MVVVVKRVQNRPGLSKRNSDSLTNMSTESPSSSQVCIFQSNRIIASKSSHVCFALDYNTANTIFPPAEPLSESEEKLCFYSVRLERAVSVLLSGYLIL